MSHSRPLTAKQRRFIDEYLIDPIAAQAYIRAGYSPLGANKNAASLMANHGIKAEIARRQAERAAKLDLTAEYVLNGLKRSAERTDEGATHGAQVRAYELLGKHLGMFRDERPVVVPPSPPPSPPMSEAERMARVEHLIALAQQRMAARQTAASPPPQQAEPTLAG